VTDDLTTAAVFGDLTQAQAARLHLEAAGIPAFVADENMAAGVFSFGAAIGGIKLQVPKSRLEETLRLLDERMPSGEVTDWSEVDFGYPEESEPDTDKLAPTKSPIESVPVEPSEELTLRERRADGMFRACVLGTVFIPALLFAFCRLFQIWISDERLRPEYRRKAQLAGAFIIPYTTLWLMAWKVFCCAGVPM
jgi:hypothetical protein